MTAPRISVLISTARADRPWRDRADLRTCDPPVLTLLAQEDAPPFEIIVADALIEKDGSFLSGRTERPWSDHPSPTSACRRIVHVSGRTDWHRRGRPGISGQTNLAAAEAQGDILVRLHDETMAPPQLLRRIAEEHDAGRWPQLLYLMVRQEKPAGPPAVPVVAPYDFLGYGGYHAIAEHRWEAVREEPWARAWWGWMFGYFTLPRAIFNSVGGCDEAFDGDVAFNDSELGSRLERAGFADAFVVVRDCYVVEVEPPKSDWPWSWSSGLTDTPAIKCNYALLKWSREHEGQHIGEMSEQTVLAIRERVCALPDGLCEVRENCSRVWAHLHPFLSKEPAATDLLSYWLHLYRAIPR